jgi:ornithine cyclodeaminase/alanine dehydrogenase
MPAYIEALGAVGIKWVGAFPTNAAKALPTISGLIVLNDAETGFPACVMDCRWVTAKRTGAKTAVAARYLARPESSAVGIVGCGVQGRSNLEAISCRFDVDTVHAYDLNRESAERFAAEMSGRRYIVQVVESAEAAVRNMDIVVTSGPIRERPEPVVQESWLKPGSFSAPVDFDSYFTGEAMQAMDIFATDDAEQFEYYRTLGFFKEAPRGERVVDLGRLESGETLGRKDELQRTMSMSLGSGMDDVAVAQLVLAAARKKGLGTILQT